MHSGVRSWKGLPKCAANGQVDNHIAELTVRETLDFAARVLGVGHKEGANPAHPLFGPVLLTATLSA
jgi:ABC-type multidrug transport system ATPase subunit